jgi:hypothetical protein
VKRTRLNFALLRKNLRLAAGDNRNNSGGANILETHLTRRRWFGVASTAAVMAVPAFKAVGKTLAGPMDVSSNKRTASFRLRSGEEWVVDTKSFAGSPTLSVDKRGEEITLELRNAKYPGTPYPADFVATIKPATFGHRMELNLLLGGFSGSVGFESWLQGMERLRSNVCLKERRCRLNNTHRIELAGSGEATLSPDWTLNIVGEEIAQCTLAGARLMCDEVALRIPSNNEERLLKDAAAKRTFMTLSRGEQHWSFTPPGHQQSGWRFDAKEDTFDVISVEATERRDGRKRFALSAEAKSGQGMLTAYPRMSFGGFRNVFGALPLQKAQYAVAFDGRGDQHALLARFSSDPLWFLVGGVGYQISDAPEILPFEFVTEGRRLNRVQCAPAILQTFVPLPDAIVEPAPVQRGTRLVFASRQDKQTKSTVQNPQIQNPQAQSQQKLQDGAKLNLPIPTIAAIRPEDLVKIDFDFKNLTLQKSGAQTVLARDKGGPGYIIATLPPQNIAEKAYYETSAGTGQTQKEKDSGRPPYPGGSETPENPPIASRIAGPSRLVFIVPGSAKPIPFTLESLLKACSELQLSVSTNASQLTADQKKVLAWLQSQGKKAQATVIGAMSTAQNLHGKIQSATQVKGVRDAVQQSMVGLKSTVSAVDAMPPGIAPSKALQKRFTTLQSAVVHASNSTPQDVQKYTQALTNFWDTAQQSNLFAVSDALSSIAPGLFAQSPTSPKPPQELETAIEAPYRLIISPNSYAGWAHQSKLPATTGRIELWHTRLGVLAQGVVLETIEALRTIRAIWTPDYNPPPPHAEGLKPSSQVTNPPPLSDGNPFRMTVDQKDRYELVQLTSNFATPLLRSLRSGIPPEPLPVNVDNLMLSSLGAWVNFRGAWDPLAPLSVESWRHRGTMGRDHYVKVVYAGFLFPFGHRASLVKITERKFQKTPSGQTAAFLRQRMFIIVREPVKTYPGEGQDSVVGGYHNAWRNPFRSIQVTTLVTPNLDSPSQTGISNSSNVNQGQSAFWPFVDNAAFRFHMRGEDWDGNHVEFAAPVIFLDQSAALDGGVLGNACTSFDTKKDNGGSLNSVPLFGQRVALADSQNPGDTTFETNAVTFGYERNTTQAAALLSQKHPPFYPILVSAEVRIKAVEELLGPAGPKVIKYDETYAKSGFDPNANKGEVFARMFDDSQHVSVDFNEDPTKSGGLVTPSMVIKGLSRSMGAVGGNVDEIRDGKFNPASFFAEFIDKVKIFGALPLTSILPDAQSLDRMPQIQSVNAGSFIDTTVTWNPQLKKDSAGLFVPSDTENGMTVRVYLHTPLDGSKPTSRVEAEIRDFMIQLLPGHAFIGVAFDSVLLRMQSGQKMDVSVKLSGDGIRFLGELAFINEIRNFIPGSGFSDPPYLEVSPSGVIVGYTQPIPTIAVGMFSLQNISLGASFEIPFDGRAVNMGFAFCTRENPFLLTVSIFGGGGFFGITIDPNGLQKLEASLEFGGAVAINLGVAQGGVYVLAGIYYYTVGKESGYEAHLRCGGALTVLGLICISVEFYMGLTYQSDGSLYGEASVEVEVSIAFFSKSVTLHTTRQFAGSSNDPLIADVYSEQDWNNYLLAFAA